MVLVQGTCALVQGGGDYSEETIMSDLDRQIEQLRRCEPLKESEVKALCMKAMEILVEESNVQRVDAPVTVSSFRLSAWLPALFRWNCSKSCIQVKM